MGLWDPMGRAGLGRAVKQVEPLMPCAVGCWYAFCGAGLLGPERQSHRHTKGIFSSLNLPKGVKWTIYP